MTVYRLLKRVEGEGERAFAERRQGHPTKLRGEVLTWMLEYCQNHRAASSADVQRRLAERFRLSVSISQLNRVRATHGLSRQGAEVPPREKKPKTGLPIASGSHEQAGGLLWLAAATETGLLTQLEQALPPSPGRQFSSASTPAADPVISGSRWLTAHVGLARLYRRWFGSPSPSVPRVALLLRRRWAKYRDFLIICS